MSIHTPQERRSAPLVYWESGPPEGSPVVLLHGFLSSGRQWRPTMLRNPDLHLLAPDLPGHGASALPRRTQSLGDYAEALEAWAGRLGLGRVALVGHSFGGGVAVDWATRWPARVARLGLCAPVGAPHTYLPAVPTWPLRVPGLRWCMVTLVTTRPVARRLFGGVTAGGGIEPEAAVARDFLWSVRRAREAFRKPEFYAFPDWERRLESLATPVELLWGAEDVVVPAADAAFFTAALRRGHLEVVPGCGHAPPVENPLRFDAFLRRVLG